MTKQQVSNEIARLEKEILFKQGILGMIESQMKVIFTDIYNLRLLEQGLAVQLPSDETLAEHAVAAEEILGRIQSAAMP